jgi:hypothetical protein
VTPAGGAGGPPVSQPVTWRASATYVTSFVEAVKALGHLDAVLPRLDEATRAMVATPGLQAWWPGNQHLALLEALAAVAGVEAVKEVSIRSSRKGMGPVVRPLATVLLSLTKTPALALLSRVGTFVSVGLKGVEARFDAHVGRPGGVAVFTFPEPVPAVMAAAWYGLFDVGFSLARAGRVVEAQVEPTVHRFIVSW